MKNLKKIALMKIVGLASLVTTGCQDTVPRTKKSQPTPLVSVEVYQHGNANLAIGDVTGNGNADLVIASEKIREREAGIYVSENKGDYQFNDPKLIASVPLYGGGRGLFGGGSPGLDIALGDYDNDGDLDIAITAEKINKKEAEIFIIDNKGKGVYSPPYTIGVVPLYQAGGLSIVSGNINGNNRTDLIVSAEHPSKKRADIYLFENKGAGQFEQRK